MSSNSEATEIFATWTAVFDVEVDRIGQRLVFRPARSAEGEVQLRSLFRRPDQIEHGYGPLIEALLSLRPDASNAEWKTVATLLGPLIHHHPAHHAQADGVVTEQMGQWLDVRERLQQFWTMTESMAAASRATPVPVASDEKREEAIDRLGMDTESRSRVAPDELERLLTAHTSRDATSPALQLADAIGNKLNEIFQDNPLQPSHPRIAPSINPFTFEVEIVVLQGLQALFLMSCILLHKSDRGFLRRCKRANCAKTVFMSRRQQYCCTPCQAADKTQRARMRKKIQVAAL